jgi:hypothetical protein
VGWDWVHLVRRPLIGLLYQHRMIDDDECGAVGGMRIGRGNRSTRRKPAPVPLCPPQIPHDLTWARTRGSGVESRWPTAWAMARPKGDITTPHYVLTPVYIMLHLCTCLNASGNSRGWQVEGEDEGHGQEFMSLLKSACNSINRSLEASRSSYLTDHAYHD